MLKKKNKGFTLIELLIAIALIAILEATVIIAFNPIELLKKSRDGIRLSNLQNINTVLALAQFDNVSMGSPLKVYVSLPSINPDCSDLNLPSLPTDWSYVCSNPQNYQKTDGTGWIPINFSSLSAFKVPLAVLPTDPVNSATNGLYFTYTIGASATPWELTDPLESSSYQTNYAANDNGASPTVYETGKTLNITPSEVVERDRETPPPVVSCGNGVLDAGEECDSTLGLSDPARMQCRSNCQGANITACGVSLLEDDKHYYIEQNLQGIENQACITINGNNITVIGNGTAKIIGDVLKVTAVKLSSGTTGARIEKCILTLADQGGGFAIAGSNSTFIENEIIQAAEGGYFRITGDSNNFERNKIHGGSFYITGAGNNFAGNEAVVNGYGFYFSPYDLSASGEKNNTCGNCRGTACSIICN